MLNIYGKELSHEEANCSFSVQGGHTITPLPGATNTKPGSAVSVRLGNVAALGNFLSFGYIMVMLRN